MTGRPNILLVTDDQHRWDFYDNRTVASLQVPNLDRLRREGMTLTNAFTNCPICMPTRFAWMYGLYASQVAAALLRNAYDWPMGLPSVPGLLQRQGYHTALVGKLHSLEGLYPRSILEEEKRTRERGFDDVFEVSGKQLAYWYDCRWTEHLKSIGQLEQYRKIEKTRGWAFKGVETGEANFLSAADSMDGFIGRHAKAWLDKYAGDKPFFLHASFCAPHNPYDPPREYLALYDPAKMPDPMGLKDPSRLEYWKRMQAAYCGAISHVDHELGQLLEVLDRRGLAGNTLVVFGTDHGDMMGHHGHGAKGPAYDTSTRTPYILRWPGCIPAGGVLEEMVEAVDLPCTILQAAGVEGPVEDRLPQSPGRSFLDYVAGKAPAHRPWAYSEFGGLAKGWRMCRQRDWKYVFSPSGGDMLFDMRQDPWELHNLIGDPGQASRVSQMRRQLLESMMQCLPPGEMKAKP